MRRKAVIDPKHLDDIYDAAADTTRWASALENIAGAVGGDAAAAFCMDPSSNRVLFYQESGLDEAAMRAFLESHQENPWTTVMSRQAEGRLVMSDDIIPIKAFRSTSFYNEVLRPQGFAFNAMAQLAKREDSYMAFNVLRSEKKGPFKAYETQLIRGLLPHVHRALTLSFRIDGFRALQSSNPQLLDRMAGAVILLDECRRPIFANRAALQLEALFHVNGKGLLWRDSSARRRLVDGLQRVTTGTPLVTFDCDIEPNRRVRVLMSSIRRGAGAQLSSFGSAAPATMIFIADIRNEAEPRLRVKAHSLTSAEARVAMLAVHTDDSREIAEQLELSQNTIKTHLKRIYSKVGVRSRAQLIRALMPLQGG